MTSSPERTLWPALTLAFLAPFIGEVLTGSTRLSFLFVFIPEVMVWGCGVLLIREAVRHWRGGTISLILMGLALAVAEEGVIQQTSLAPFAWSIASGSYGRLWGVNWIWFLGMLGYECIWITVVPVAVTELLFRKQRDESWLGPVGRVVTSLIFLIGSLIAWFLWTHIARPKTYHVPVYQPPATQILLGIGIVASLITAAYLLRKPRTSFLHTWKMPVWAGVILALLLASPWFRLIGMMFTRKPVEPFWLVLILGCIWAALAWTLLRWVASVPDWTDMHRWALAFGAVLTSMAWGFSGSSAWHKADLIAKIIFNILAIVAFLLLAARLQTTATEGVPHDSRVFEDILSAICIRIETLEICRWECVDVGRSAVNRRPSWLRRSCRKQSPTLSRTPTIV